MSDNIVKPVRFGDQIEVEVTSLAFGGDAVGRFQDFAIFIPGGLPGERVRLKITQVKDHYASGEILSVLRSSSDRITPACSIFEECGGCQWQHFNYPRQLQTKRQFVVDALQRIGRLSNVTVQPCLPSPNPYAYRNKAMPVLSMRDGHFVSGIYEPRSHHLIPYHTCPIQGDAVNDLIQKVLKKIDRSGLTPYQEKKHEGFLRHLTVRQGVKTGELLLAFITRTQVPEERLQKPTVLPEEMEQILPRIAKELMAEVPGLVGVLQNINASRTNIVFGPTTRILEGRDYYFEIIDNLNLKVSLKSFLQVNTLQADILHEIVREALGEPLHKKKWGTVLDLYSGIGTLSMAVADRADYVVGAEEVGPAVDDARANAEMNQKKNIDYLEGDVAQILLGLREKGLTQIDAVILDPPRKGVLPETLARLASFHPERMVYVSCDPSTLARDLALLTKHGYAVEWAQPLDMFPQTYHVETVVKLTRETPLPPEIQSQNAQAQLEPFRLPRSQDTVSMNISANFTALKEKTGVLLTDIGQQGKAVFNLFGSLLALAGHLVARAGWFFGKAVISPFRAAGSLLMRSKTIPSQEALSPGSETVQPLKPLPIEIDPPVFEPAETEEFAATLLTETIPIEKTEDVPIPMMETSVEIEAPAVEMAEEPLMIEKPEETLRATLTKISETPVPLAAQPLAPAVSEPLTVEAEKDEIPVPAVVSAPPTVSTPEPVLSEVPAASVQPQPEIPKRRMTFRLPKLPVIRIPIGRVFHAFWNQSALRWALITLFLVGGGGFLAKAALSPDAKKTSVLVPSISQMIPDLIAVMPNRNFLRYEMVPFEIRVNSQDLPNFSQMHATVEVLFNGNPVEMVDGRTKLNLKRDLSKGRFIGNWPIPYNPPAGTYTAQLTVTGPQWSDPKTFESAFTISPLKPHGLYPGYAGLTMEGGKQLINGAVPALDGSENLSAANVVDWAKFMGANVYCYLMGQTSIWDHLNPKDFPFNRGDMENGHKYARYCHDAGLKFAGYMTTFKVVGDAWNQASYDFSSEYDPETDQVIQSRFISLNDKKRQQDIVDFLRELDKDPNVDMIGMDYVRTGAGGYELVDEFVKDLSVPGPSNFWSMTKEERIHWLAKTVERREDMEVVYLFQWWRAHKVALTLRSILEEAKVSKPVFTFTLGWEQGHQHGQDPAMYIDAGISYNHIMLYEGDRGTMEAMKKQWPEYLSNGNGMYAMGEMVDFNWVQKSLDPPGPEELYNREVEAFHNWFPENASLGMFWHDLYRLVYGIRGPYSSMEWTIAGGKAFSTLQQAEGVSSVEVHLLAPKSIPAGVPVPITVEIHNHSTENMNGVVLHQLDTSKNYYVDLATVGPFDLPAGNMVRVKSLYVNIPREDHPERDNRYMAAVMVEKPGQPLRTFDFVYMKKLSHNRAVKNLDSPTDPDPAEGESPQKSPGSKGADEHQPKAE